MLAAEAAIAPMVLSDLSLATLAAKFLRVDFVSLGNVGEVELN